MLKQLGYASLDELTDAAVPDDIKLNRDLTLDDPLSEYELIKRIQGIANRNQVSQTLLLLSLLHSSAGRETEGRWGGGEVGLFTFLILTSSREGNS